MDSHEIFVNKKLKKAASLIKSNSKVLDIGCWDGRIRNFLKNCNYHGIDINKEQIINLKKQGIKVKQVDLNKQSIPFNEKFDYILLLDILEHVANSKKLLQESKKFLNQDGKLIITLPNDYHILNKIRFLFNKNLTEDPFSSIGHLHYFPIKSGEDFLIKQGFKIKTKILIPPIKPTIIPQAIKNFLTKISPQNFSRDVLYVLEV